MTFLWIIHLLLRLMRLLLTSSFQILEWKSGEEACPRIPYSRGWGCLLCSKWVLWICHWFHCSEISACFPWYWCSKQGIASCNWNISFWTQLGWFEADVRVKEGQRIFGNLQIFKKCSVPWWETCLVSSLISCLSLDVSLILINKLVYELISI